MCANEDFEAFAERFSTKFGYLPLGKDPGTIGRPPVEDVLCDLGRTFGELEAAVLAQQQPTQVKSSAGATVKGKLPTFEECKKSLAAHNLSEWGLTLVPADINIVKFVHDYISRQLLLT